MVLPGSQDLLENPEYLVLLGYLEIQVDQERWVRKVLRVHQDHREDLVCLDLLDFQDSLEREDFLDFLVCLG